MKSLRGVVAVIKRFLGLGETERRERELEDELHFHIAMQTEENLRNGMSSDDARRQAAVLFGGMEGHREACRESRPGHTLDDLARDVRYTVRSLRRAPLAALTIVATVGLGLGLVATVFTILNAYIFRADEVREPHELFAVERERSANLEPEPFTHPLYEALLRETSIFTDAFATTQATDAWIEGRRMEGPLVTGNFFHVLGASTALGRVLTPADDEPGSPPVIVLSHPTWTREFASDPGLIGGTVRVNGTPFRVVGVMAEGFRGLAPVAAPDYWVPLSLLNEIRRTEGISVDDVGLDIVGRLNPGLASGQAIEELRAWDAGRAVERFGDRPAATLNLVPRQGTIPLSVETMLVFTPIFFAFGLILLIGCANVANLLFARGVARQRELGIRLALGASRGRLVWQLLTESLFLALVSAAIAFGIARGVLRGVVYAVTSTFPPDLGDLRLAVPPADWRVVLFLVAGAIASTLFFALAPALQATRLELVRAIRGEVVRDARPGRTRDALITIQVTGSALLLICAVVFLRGSREASAVDPGIRTADIVNVSVLNEQRRGAILDIVRSEPTVASVAAASPSLLYGLPAFVDGDGANGDAAVRYQYVSREYFEILGIDLVRGRGFTPAERGANAGVAVVSESAARELWPGADALGQLLRLEPDPTLPPDGRDDPPVLPGTAVVIGIAKDVAGFRLGGFRMSGADVYMPIDVDAPGALLTMRVLADPERARHALVDRFAAIDPNMAEVETLRAMASAEAYLLGIPFWLTLMLGGLALLLTLSGLFSVISYLVERRSREIGVRMALGATRRGIAALVISQSIRPVGIGLFLGVGFTAALGAVILATPAAEQIGTSVRLLDPVAYVVGLFWIVAACACAALIPTVRAARIDPAGALRRD